jgi:hypothetical protein
MRKKIDLKGCKMSLRNWQRDERIMRLFVIDDQYVSQ